MHSSQQTKINRLTPNSNHFDLLFELTQITNRSKDTLNCRIVDDTGIIDAQFNRHIDKLESGFVYLMTNLQVQIANGRLLVIMSKQTSTTKEADTLGFKDKANDISIKKFTNQPQNSKPQIPALDPGPTKKEETLIPFTKQQAEEQLKLKREFQKQMRGRRTSDFSMKQRGQEFKEKQKQKYKGKGNDQNNNYNEYGLKLKYKEKDGNYQEKSNQEKGKKQYKAKDENKRSKAKSLMYREKI